MNTTTRTADMTWFTITARNTAVSGKNPDPQQATPRITMPGQNTTTTWTPNPQQPQRRTTVKGRTSLDPTRLTPDDRIIDDADWPDLTDMLKDACEDSLLLRAQLSRRIINSRNIATIPDEVLEHMVMVPDGLNGTTTTFGLIRKHTDPRNTDAYHRRIWRYLQKQLADTETDLPDWPAATNQPDRWTYPAQTGPAGPAQRHPIWDMFKQLADSAATIGEVAQIIRMLETAKPEQPGTEAATATTA